MTTLLTPDAATPTPPVDSPPAATPPGTGARRRRRWARVVAPLLAAFALIVATLVVHAIAQPSTTDPDYLNPASDASIGALSVARGVTSRGITLTVVHASDDAIALARRGNATLFVPAPDLVRPGNQIALRTLPPSVTVIAVRPSPVALDYAGYGFLGVHRRWATTPATGCVLPGLGPSTRALVDRDRYATAPGIPADVVPAATVDCFGHAVRAWQPYGMPEFVLVSANDVFRNDRVGELDDAAVASALLTRHPTLIWLDLHRGEPQPKPQGANAPPPPDGDQGGQRT
ncbi:MAG TPA: hypothetical protein VHA75_00760, partial [Rugosimonospora sp.]|nr:hypothetical protein [Rugosimonospora sp.]